MRMKQSCEGLKYFEPFDVFVFHDCTFELFKLRLAPRDSLFVRGFVLPRSALKQSPRYLGSFQSIDRCDQVPNGLVKGVQQSTRCFTEQLNDFLQMSLILSIPGGERMFKSASV